MKDSNRSDWIYVVKSVCSLIKNVDIVYNTLHFQHICFKSVLFYFREVVEF